MVRVQLFRAAALATMILLAGFANDLAIGETILLDFGSPSCGPCRQMRPVIHDMIADGYPIREIDLSRDSAAARDFRVLSVPCFILLVDGKVADRVEGSVPRATIEAMFQKVGYQPGSESSDSETLVRGQSPNRGSLLGGRLRDRVTGVNPAAPRTFGDSPFAPSAAAPENHAPAAHAGAGVAASGQTQRLIEATVRIEVADATGKSYGTGTIIHSDANETIVLTCGHLFRETRGQSPVTVELFRSTPAGAEQIGAAQGDVLSYDLDRDIGLIRVRTNGQVPSIEIAAPNTAPQSGDSVVSIGCDHGQPPSARNSHVTTVNRYTGPSNIEATGAPVEGRSGGGLFNVQGQLIGVCFAADARGNEGLYSGLPSVYEELARAGVQLPNSAPTIASAAIPTSPVNATTPSPTPQPRPDVDSFAGVSSAPSNSIVQAGEPMPAPASIRPEEQAALEEVARRSDNSEVIFIIRSKTPGGRSQIIKLEDASPAFVSALVDAAATNSGTRLTSHEVIQPSMALSPTPARSRPEPMGTRKPACDAENWSSKR